MLRELIDQYLVAFPGERERVSPVYDLLAVATEREAVSRDHKTGHVTASGFVISPSRSHLLLIHHKKLQRLLQPGGHMESDDATPLAGAKREIAEETRLTSLLHIPYHVNELVPIDIDVHTIPARGDEPQHLHHDFRYLFVCQDESELLHDENEIEGVSWRPISAAMEFEMFRWLKPKLERVLAAEFRKEVGGSNH